MRKRLKSLFTSDGLKARAARGVSMSIVSMVGQNGLRLISNLILTRLLVPEAFGLMAIIGVFTTGLQMFSDLGIKTSIIRSPRDDEDFLNTAWTMQILRGAVLGLGCAAIAYPLSLVYDEPMLFPLMVFVGLNPFVSGFVTTNQSTARRKLYLSRVVMIRLLGQVVGILAMVAVAWFTRSVWALAMGTVVGSAARVLMYRAWMPGIVNRFRWEPEAVREIFNFGKFVFLSTMVTFLITQGDKLVLGLYISTGLLGVYNIGYTLGILPLFLIQGVLRGVIFPIYRMRPPAESVQNQRNLFRIRRTLISAALAGNALLALIGVPLVDFMYDDRYILAGPVISLMCLASVPLIVFEGYGNALMAHGDTRRMFYVQVVTVVVQMTLLFLAITQIGLFGAVIVPGIAAVITYPMLRTYVKRYKALDAKGDIFFMVAGLTVTGTICWFNRDAILQLMTM